MLRIENLSKVYQVGTFGSKKLHAVNHVTFDVPKGEVVSLIGESGSGKSTIGRMILGLIQRTAGTICVDGVDVSTLIKNSPKEYYRKVQGVFQDPFSSYNPIFKADRVFSCLRDEFFPGMSGSEWRERLIASVQAVGMSPDCCLDHYPHQLSGGQLQRLLIARALLLDIEYLVADEVISMLDASTRIDVLNLLADLKSRGLSILFITHDLSLGYYISTKSVILYKGYAVEQGSTEKIYTNPLHPYTKMLMACVPRLDKKWDELDTQLAASQSASLGGCAYYGRCPVGDKSLGRDRFKPPVVEVEPDHLVSCYRLMN